MYDDDKKRVGHDATDFAAFGLPDPFRGYAKRSGNNTSDTNTFIADVWP